jgi:ubiquinone/menaquinone biosynthesis C-methylase UbiE
MKRLENPSQINSMREHWKAEAAGYTEDRHWSSVDETVLSLLEITGSESLLEIGLGPGLVAQHLVNNYPKLEYYGLDVADFFLKMAASRMNQHANLLKADTRALPFQAQSFDRILEMDAIHHVPKEALPGVLREISRVLKPGGRLICAEDWAAPATDARTRLADSLQRRRPIVQKGWEYHPSENEWRRFFAAAQLQILREQRVDRPLNLDRFENLKGVQARSELTQLRELWAGDHPITTMTIFICRKN